MRRKREVLLISSIRTTMVFSYSKVLPNPWEKTASATIIVYQSLAQFLHSRHENSKYDISSYASKQSIEVQSISNSARSSNYSKGFQRIPKAICRKDHIHIYINKKDGNYILKPINSTRKVTLLNLAETYKSSGRIQLSNQTRVVYILSLTSSSMCDPAESLFNRSRFERSQL